MVIEYITNYNLLLINVFIALTGGNGRKIYICIKDIQYIPMKMMKGGQGKGKQKRRTTRGADTPRRI